VAERGERGTWRWLAYWDGQEIAPDRTLRELPANDLDAALLIRTEWLDKIHFAADTAEWYIWDQSCHATDTSGTAGKLVSNWIRRADMAWSMAAEAVRQQAVLQAGLDASDTDRKRAIESAMAPYAAAGKYIAGLRATGKHQALVKMVSVECSCSVTELAERQPGWLNCADVTVDLASGLCKPHDPADMLTYAVPVPYRPGAPCPRFLELVSGSAGHDAAVAEYLLDVLGYVLIGANPERKIFFINGPTSSGKSALLDVVRGVLGPDLAHSSQAALITLVRHGRNARTMNSVRGKRLLTITETSSFMHIDEGQVKMITGETMVSVDQLYAKREIPTPVTWAIIVATNRMPSLLDFDPAMAERVVVIPGGPTIPEHLRDKHLAARILAEEKEGILALLIARCARYYARGLMAPVEVQAETDKYRSEQNTVEQFLADCTMPVTWLPGGGVAAIAMTEMWETYVRWSRGSAHLTRPQFYERTGASPGISRNDSSRRFEGIIWSPAVLSKLENPGIQRGYQ
jgi:P4 family phage/plasmid primase-like protien